jgi:hypothetical protein
MLNINKNIKNLIYNADFVAVRNINQICVYNPKYNQNLHNF